MFCLLFLRKNNFQNVALRKQCEYINIHSYLLRKLWLVLKLSTIHYFYRNMLFKMRNITVKCSGSLFLSRTLCKNTVIRTRISWGHGLTMIRRMDFFYCFYQGRYINIWLLFIQIYPLKETNLPGLPFPETWEQLSFERNIRSFIEVSVSWSILNFLGVDWTILFP